MDRKRGWFENDISSCSLTGFICEDEKGVVDEDAGQELSVAVGCPVSPVAVRLK